MLFYFYYIFNYRFHIKHFVIYFIT